MFRLFIYGLILVSTLVSTSVLDETRAECSGLEFPCGDGSCVTLSSLCDGRSDCLDGADEATCSGGSRWLSREKRQTRLKCPSDQWQCGDGTCISADAVRDGTNDCLDGTDEMTFICDSTTQFQCKDTSCIDIDLKCNSVRECPDGSDEVNPDCGVELQIGFTKHERYDAPIQTIAHLPGVCEMPPYPAHGTYMVHSRPTARPGEVFKTAILVVSCDAGYEVAGSADVICYDGIWSAMIPDCVLTIELCVLPRFPEHGSYIMIGNPDASPRQAYTTAELDITCDAGYDMSGQTSLTVICHNGRWSGEITDCILTKGACELPPFPANGGYEVAGVSNPTPGQTFVRVALNMTCNPGYAIHGDKGRTCYNGVWSGNLTDCLALCHLDKDPTVEYQCVPDNRECNLDEPDGTIVKPVCKQDYFFPGDLNHMVCVDGSWNYVAKCVPVSSGACILPPYPANGSYEVTGVPNYAPGQAFITVALTITCLPTHDIVGSKERMCYAGVWSGDVTDCVPKTELCILPPLPSFGYYSVPASLGSQPGEAFDVIALEYRCDLGFDEPLNKRVTCDKGKWSAKIDKCNRTASETRRPILGPVFNVNVNNTRQPTGLSGYCRLKKDPSVNYLCLLSAASTATRECREIEPIGTIVRPECKVPNYYFPGVLNHMRCFDDKWNYIARCVPECGLVTPKGTELVIGGRFAERGELPWHAGVYQKARRSNNRNQICGGSLISPKLVISAGHCFIDNNSNKQPASNYAVALGKIYRRWDHEMDEEVQKSDLIDLKFPSRFVGGLANFQEDIALLFLMETIIYQKHIRPICVDYNIEIEKEQLMPGSLGKVAGWGLTSANANPSEVLKVVELPVVAIEECQAEAPLEFREFITGDKICAGYRNGTAVCTGDSGGGLAFPRVDQDKTRYYLRGVVSIAPVNETLLCNAFWLTTFTQVSRHERFIKDNTIM